MSQFAQGISGFSTGLESGLRLAQDRRRQRLLELQATAMEEELNYARTTREAREEAVRLQNELTRQAIAEAEPRAKGMALENTLREIDVEIKRMEKESKERNVPADKLEAMNRAKEAMKAGVLDAETFEGLPDTVKTMYKKAYGSAFIQALEAGSGPLTMEDFGNIARDLGSPTEVSQGVMASFLKTQHDEEERQLNAKLIQTGAGLVAEYGAQRAPALAQAIDPRIGPVVEQGGGFENLVTTRQTRDRLQLASELMANIGTFGFAGVRGMAEEAAPELVPAFDKIEDLGLQEVLSPEAPLTEIERIHANRLGQAWLANYDQGLYDGIAALEAKGDLSASEQRQLDQLRGQAFLREVHLRELDAMQERLATKRQTLAGTKRAEPAPEPVPTPSPTPEATIPTKNVRAISTTELNRVQLTGDETDDQLKEFQADLLSQGKKASLAELKAARSRSARITAIRSRYESLRQSAINKLSGSALNRRMRELDRDESEEIAELLGPKRTGGELGRGRGPYSSQ